MRALDRWEEPPKVEPSFPDVLEWHRDERRFVDVVLKSIAGTVTTKQPAGVKQAMTLADLRISDEKPEPAHYGHHAVHLLPEYRELKPTVKGEDAHASLFDEIADSFAECGVRVIERRMEGVPSVVLLCPELFERLEMVHALLSILPANPELPAAASKSGAAGKTAKQLAAELVEARVHHGSVTDLKKIAAESKKAAKRLVTEAKAEDAHEDRQLEYRTPRSIDLAGEVPACRNRGARPGCRVPDRSLGSVRRGAGRPFDFGGRRGVERTA